MSDLRIDPGLSGAELRAALADARSVLDSTVTLRRHAPAGGVGTQRQVKELTFQARGRIERAGGGNLEEGALGLSAEERYVLFVSAETMPLAGDEASSPGLPGVEVVVESVRRCRFVGPEPILWEAEGVRKRAS